MIRIIRKGFGPCGPGAIPMTGCGMDPVTKTWPSQTRWMGPVMGWLPSQQNWDGFIPYTQGMDPAQKIRIDPSQNPAKSINGIGNVQVMLKVV